METTLVSGGMKMKWFINSMLGYWCLLLAISLGAAAWVYLAWLKDVM